MPWKGHVRFGGRSAETGRWQRRYRRSPTLTSAVDTGSGISGITAFGCSSSRVGSSGDIVHGRQPSDRRSRIKCEAPQKPGSPD